MFREKEEIILPASPFIQNEQDIPGNWLGSALLTESTLHQISPYIGKMKSSMSRTLIEKFSNPFDIVYDPFCGAGTVALEAWASGSHVLTTDLNPYAVLLTRAKLFPPSSKGKIVRDIDHYSVEVQHLLPGINIETVPLWVRNFFNPRTLAEIIAWIQVLKQYKADFLTACLLGILHHQRPGFLSYPCSHTVPYLRDKKFPKETYPALYEYREVAIRLKRKAERALKRLPVLNYGLIRECTQQDALNFEPKQKINAIITSPPYMRQLDYGRDNRLRLWFIGCEDWNSLNSKISPPEKEFIELMKKCLERWHDYLIPGGHCVLVLGDANCRSYKLPLPEVITHIAIEEVKGYSLVWQCTEKIPNSRRVRRNCSGSTSETILALKKMERPVT